jgi:hypothetical protein
MCTLSPIHRLSIIIWWLASPPLRGCYLPSQIFAEQSEAEIGIRLPKGVNWHPFHITCAKFELEQSFQGAFFEDTLIGLFKLKYTSKKICHHWLSSTVVALDQDCQFELEVDTFQYALGASLWQ